MRHLKNHYKLLFCEVVFSLFLSQAVVAGNAGEVKRLDNLSDPTTLKTRGTTPPCASDILKNHPQSLSTSGQSNTHAQACLVKVEATIDALSKGRVSIVDTRTATEFGKYRIPGSLNIAAHAVKTKSFLKSQAFVLVDANHSSAELESVCADLRRNGYSKAAVLQGGLSLWKAHAGLLEGDVITARGLNIVRPAEFVQEQSVNEWLVIDVSNHKISDIKKNFPSAISVPWATTHKDDKALLSVISSAANKRVLIIDESGDSYSGIESLPGIQRKDVLYLDGGFRAYLKYRREQITMWKQRDDPPKRKGCST